MNYASQTSKKRKRNRDDGDSSDQEIDNKQDDQVSILDTNAQPVVLRLLWTLGRARCSHWGEESRKFAGWYVLMCSCLQSVRQANSQHSLRHRG